MGHRFCVQQEHCSALMHTGSANMEICRLLEGCQSSLRPVLRSVARGTKVRSTKYLFTLRTLQTSLLFVPGQKGPRLKIYLMIAVLGEQRIRAEQIEASIDMGATIHPPFESSTKDDVAMQPPPFLLPRRSCSSSFQPYSAKVSKRSSQNPRGVAGSPSQRM